MSVLVNGNIFILAYFLWLSTERFRDAIFVQVLSFKIQRSASRFNRSKLLTAAAEFSIEIPRISALSCQFLSNFQFPSLNLRFLLAFYPFQLY